MKNDLFETSPIPKAVATLAIPMMIGMLVTVIYNLADTFFVGQLNDANQVAAVTITMPVFMCLMSFGSIFGIGGGSYISRLLGNKDVAMVKKVSAVSLYSAFALGFLCIILGLWFLNPLLSMLGTSDMTYNFAKDYLRIIIIGAPAVVLSFSMGQIVRSEGAAKVAMVGMMVGTVVNIVLDPVLILFLHMGVAGAAYATIFANIVSVIYYILYFFKKGTSLSIFPSDFTFNGTLYKNILMIGIPASLNTILMSFSNIILNNFAAGYGDNVVAALGIVSKIIMLPIMLMIGLCQGVQPLIGYNYSSGNRNRMLSAIKFTGSVVTLIGVCFTILISIVGGNAVKVFIQDPEVVRLGTQFVKINIMSVPFIGIMFLVINVFQATGKGLASLVLSVCRQGIIFIPILFITNTFIGLDGLIFAQPISDISSTILSVILFLIIIRKPTATLHNDLTD